MSSRIVYVLVLRAALILADCGNVSDKSVFPAETEESAFQGAYDMRVNAKDYTKQLYISMLESHGTSDFEILERGCDTEDPLGFITGYRYLAGEQETVYGY